MFLHGFKVGLTQISGNMKIEAAVVSEVKHHIFIYFFHLKLNNDIECNRSIKVHRNKRHIRLCYPSN